MKRARSGPSMTWVNDVSGRPRASATAGVPQIRTAGPLIGRGRR